MPILIGLSLPYLEYLLLIVTYAAVRLGVVHFSPTWQAVEAAEEFEIAYASRAKARSGVKKNG
jgi:hypothetical protein